MSHIYSQIAFVLLSSVNAYCFWSTSPTNPKFVNLQIQNIKPLIVSRPALAKFSQRESQIPRSITSLPAIETTPTPDKRRGTLIAVKYDEMEQMAQQTAKSAAIGLRYDPLEADRYWSSRTLQVWKRDMEISVPITAFLGKVLIDYQQGMEERNRQLRAREFMSIIASLGPAFIKAGQALSSRPDLLPPEYLTELQKLQDRLPPFSNAVAFRIMEEQLGVPIDSVFERIEPEPVAAASIGQVYKGYLRTGEAVAIKIQRPECEEVIALDIYILRQLSGGLSKMIKLLRRDVDLRMIVEEFGRLIYEEIDYLQEARNADKFAELYSSCPDVYVPRIHWRFSGRRMLTMEWVDGVRLTSPALGMETKTALVKAMVQCSLRQMLEKGFFHADPHGGNLLARADGKLVYLDFGMMSEVEPFQRYGILEAVVHMVNRDFGSLCRLYVRLGFIPVGTDLAPIESALASALPDVLGASVEDFNFKSVITKLGDIMYKFPFSLPPYYTAIVRCLGVLEGLAIQVDGRFRIISNAYPYIASRVLSDPQLQTSLQYMVFASDGRVRWARLDDLLQSASTADDWDVGQAVDLFADFVLDSRNGAIREGLADDVTDAVDSVGLDLLHMATDSLRSLRLPPFPPPLSLPASLPSLPLPGRPKAVAAAPATPAPAGPSGGPSMKAFDSAMRAFETVARSPTMTRLSADPREAARLLQRVAERVLVRREAQRLAADAGLQLIERASTRAVRLVFGMPQPPARDLPRLTPRGPPGPPGPAGKSSPGR